MNRLSGGILVLSCLVGCAGRFEVRPFAIPAAPAASQAPTTWRGSFKGSLDLGDEKQRFEGTLALEAPDRLYVEIVGPLGGVRAVMAVKGERVLVLFPGRREFLEEAATPAAYELLLGLRLDTPALIDLIQFGAATSCANDPCERRISLSPDARGMSGDLLISRQADHLSARPADRVAAATGARGLELRLVPIATPDPGPIDGALFTPLIPEGWTRLRPPAGGGPGSLLLSR